MMWGIGFRVITINFMQPKYWIVERGQKPIERIIFARAFFFFRSSKPTINSCANVIKIISLNGDERLFPTK
jgi:hypothetical protein